MYKKLYIKRHSLRNEYGEVFHYDIVEVVDKETDETKREWLPVKMKYEGYDRQ